jgi:hypothetical protein
MTNTNDLKRINTPLLAYMIKLLDPVTDEALTADEKRKRKKTLGFLQLEMENRKLIQAVTK